MPRSREILRSNALHAAALALLASAACAPVQSAAPVEAPNPVPETPAPPVLRPAPQVRLTQLSREALNGRTDYRALGLAGNNKANGIDYRLRETLTVQLPRSVPYELEGKFVMIADSTPEGWFVLYRSPLDQGRAMHGNPDYFAVLYTPAGQRIWHRALNPFLSRPDHLEIQDARYEHGKLYFNEACQSYSSEAGGRCSSLVRVDAGTWKEDWRTPPLTSNNVFLLRGPYVIAGYGFTREPDHLNVLDRETGRALARVPLDSAPSYLEFKGDELYVVTYSSLYRFRFEG